MFSFGLGLFSVLTMTADQIGSAFYSAMLELLRSDRPPVSNFNYEGPLKLGKVLQKGPHNNFDNFNKKKVRSRKERKLLKNICSSWMSHLLTKVLKPSFIIQNSSCFSLFRKLAIFLNAAMEFFEL